MGVLYIYEEAKKKPSVYCHLVNINLAKTVSRNLTFAKLVSRNLTFGEISFKSYFKQKYSRRREIILTKFEDS
jgi:hypothetical protein